MSVDTSPAPSTWLALRRSPAVLRLTSSVAVSEVGTQVTLLALPLLALLQLGAGAGVVGLLTAAQFVPWVVLALPIGATVDGWSPPRHRQALVASDLVRAVLLAALPVLYATGRLTVPLLLLVVLLVGATTVLAEITSGTVVPEVVERGLLAHVNGSIEAARSLAMVVGPALAGVLVGQVGPRVPLLLDAVSYLALVVVGLLIRTRRGTADSTATDAVRFRLRDDRGLLVMTVAVATVVAGVSAINVFEVFFIRETLGASTTVYGFVMASWTAGMVIGSLSFGRVPHRLLTLRLVLALLTVSCLMVVAAAAVPAAGWMVPLWIVGGIANGALNVCTTVIIAGRVPAAAHGRAFSVCTAAVQGAGLFGLMVAGPLAEQFDPRVLVAGAGLTGVLAAFACLPLVRREPPVTLPAGRRTEIPDNVAG